MTSLRQGAEQALAAIEQGWSFDRLDNEIAPLLREALAGDGPPELDEAVVMILWRTACFRSTGTTAELILDFARRVLAEGRD